MMKQTIDEIKEIAESGTLPDGDGVNEPTRMWAEDVVKRMSDYSSEHQVDAGVMEGNNRHSGEHKGFNRFDDKCPRCGGNNSPRYGGNQTCFHCGDCGFTECVVFTPVENDKPIENEIERYKKRLIAFRDSRRA